MEKKFYTVDELFELAGGVIAKNTIYKYVRAGKIPAKKFGDKWLIMSSFVDRFMNDPDFSIQ